MYIMTQSDHFVKWKTNISPEIFMEAALSPAVVLKESNYFELHNSLSAMPLPARQRNGVTIPGCFHLENQPVKMYIGNSYLNFLSLITIYIKEGS